MAWHGARNPWSLIHATVQCTSVTYKVNTNVHDASMEGPCPFVTDGQRQRPSQVGTYVNYPCQSARNPARNPARNRRHPVSVQTACRDGGPMVPGRCHGLPRFVCSTEHIPSWFLWPRRPLCLLVLRSMCVHAYMQSTQHQDVKKSRRATCCMAAVDPEAQRAG